MNQSEPDIAVIDSPERSRFEAAVAGRVAFADYKRLRNLLIITHTEVPPELRGRGLGAILMREIVAHARARQWKIDPQCSYAERYLDEHPQDKDVRAG